MRDVVQELQIYQIELELQNEELRRAHKELEDTRTRYMRLYNDAPVGYIVLDGAGSILQVNATFARMIRRDAARLRGKAFADLLDEADRSVFLARYKSFLKNPSGKSMEVRIKSGADAALDLHLEALPYPHEALDPPGGSDQLLITLNDISARKRAEAERERLIGELQSALNEMKILRGLLPICCICKSIRDDKGYWSQIEAYISKHTAAQFSHSICPDCARKHYPDLDIYDRSVK